MSGYRVVDVHGFAGAFSVAAVQSGFELVGKLEGPGGFGTPLLEANRAFLGGNWEAQEGDPASWKTVKADLVVGTPPCTAFSGMSVGSKDRGISGSINHCMWDFIRYAAKVRPAVVMMESVAQAYTNGRPLMRELARELNDLTGLHYRTTHVLQNNLSTGGCTNRRRYFLVLSQVPFGVEVPVLEKLPTIEDAIGDLRDLQIQWDEQPVTHPYSWWSSKETIRREDGLVDGHYTDDTPFARAMRVVTDRPHGVEWTFGEDVNATLRAYYDKHGRLPAEWHDRPYHGKRGDENGRFTTQEQALVGQRFNTGGFARARKWRWNRPGFVITGAGFYSTWHPEERYYTHREIARVMGFPDAYVVGSARSERALTAYWGKGTSVHPAKFATDWARRSLDGNPGSVVGELLDEGDRLIDISNIWRPVARQQFGTTQFGGVDKIRREAREVPATV